MTNNIFSISVCLKVFWKWITNSFAHSMMIYFTCYGALRHDVSLPGGQVGDYLFMGCHVYTYCVIVVCLKSGLETDSWTAFTHLSIWGSILSWFLFLIGYSYFWPILGLAPEMTYMVQYFSNTRIFFLIVLNQMSFVMKNSLGTELVQESILLDRHDLCAGIHTSSRRVLQVITAHNVQD